MASKVKVKKSLRRGRGKSSRISDKNQITLPVEILRSIGLQSGDFVEFRVEEGAVVMTHSEGGAQKQHKIMALAGDMTELYQGFDLEAERASWNRSWQ
jgi:AbrB family looped-hinge helix DNA binding protein